MKIYNVTVNGTKYQVEVEAVDKASVNTAAPVETPKPIVVGEGEKVIAPMPGNILAVNVKAGQSVKKSDVLMILEAMKMENEIVAPIDGTIKEVAVATGNSVETSALLCVIG